MPVIDSPSGPIEFLDEGEGAPVVFIHGSFADARAWRAVQQALPPGLRSVTPNLWGGGGTAPPPADAPPTIAGQAALVEAVIARIARPAHLVAHSHGAIVALDLALRRPEAVPSLTLLDPMPANLLPLGGFEAERRRLRAFYDAYRAAVRAGPAEAAAEQVVDLWEGQGAFARLPERMRARIEAGLEANLLDWEANWAWRPDPTALRSLEVPTLILSGAAGNPVARAMSAALAGLLPKAELRELPDARHMMLATHAPAIAQAVVERTGADGAPPP